MAIPVYLWLKDDAGNPVKGSVEIQQREGSIEITALAHDVSLPTDDLSGKITATREHAPFILTKALDSSSPYLYQFVSSGKLLKSAELKFYRINNAGQEEEYFNVLLENARITCVVPIMEDVKDPTYERQEHLEVLEMMYKKITWKYLDGNIIHSDSWKGRSAA
ncbi:type VI secretion system tube protein Hcp [Jejubacter calystegiae]|uniref:Type VI secretion system tube protein Hcp n=1 Tax=Jejubacter calystegiae TaxID=2579935 RepID=A0A4P8YP54_9ENTR|nr:type VI secretion system tube protein TssD [Jejubacter calystegiae]QCT21936.1 type VI secretion system tube protein Hcp [Jejubacter calystegiae]